MKKTLLAGVMAVALTAAIWISGTAHASILMSTEWGAGGSGTGTGTLDSVNINYVTASTHGGGESFSFNWLVLTGQLGMDVTAISSNTSGTLATNNSVTTQTITFDAPVSNPILFINWLSVGDSFDFGALNFTLLGANGASRTSNIVSADASVNVIFQEH